MEGQLPLLETAESKKEDQKIHQFIKHADDIHRDLRAAESRVRRNQWWHEYWKQKDVKRLREEKKRAARMLETARQADWASVEAGRIRKKLNEITRKAAL